MTILFTYLSIPMILTIDQLLEDIDCPELCNNSSFTLISEGSGANMMDAETYSNYLAYGIQTRD